MSEWGWSQKRAQESLRMPGRFVQDVVMFFFFISNCAFSHNARNVVVVMVLFSFNLSLLEKERLKNRDS